MILEVAILNVRATEKDAFEKAFSNAQKIIVSNNQTDTFY